MEHDNLPAGTRETILRRARELFLAQGYHKTSMRAIARTAGISTGPLYFHFQNKAEVFYHICRDAGERLVADFRQAASGSGHAGIRLRSIYRAYRDFYYREPELFEILHLATNPRAGVDLPQSLRDDLDRNFGEMLLIMEDIIREGISAGELRPVEPRHLALYLYSLAEGVFMANQTGVLRRSGTSLDEMIEAAIGLTGVGMVNLPAAWADGDRGCLSPDKKNGGHNHD
ncbi:MAG TPA: TetR/AcrR family transcriptional regulator [Selenomonadales bacterium]|nr:TetR/AcrR family transcriptional regulator [Selenomonadales bacterium]